MAPTKIFRRKSFNVDAVLVTGENMHAVAAWCSGKVEQMPKPINGKNRGIKLKIHGNRGRLRDVYAIVGNWVAETPESGFKVYTDKAFRLNFEDGDELAAKEKKVEEIQKVVYEIIQRQERRIVIGMSSTEEDENYTRKIAEEIYQLV